MPSESDRPWFGLRTPWKEQKVLEAMEECVALFNSS